MHLTSCDDMDPEISAEDAKSKREIAAAVDAYFKFDGHRFLRPTRYRLDTMSFRNRGNDFPEPKLFYEAKKRDCAFGEHRGGCLLSLSKVLAARWIFHATSVPCSLFGQFTDGVIAGVNILRHDGGLYVGGRTDTGLYYDIEPVVLFPWDRFTIIVS
jgi:hypothetical protein